MSDDATGTCRPEAARPVRLRPRRPCPVCSKPSQQKYHPFCSGRCADLDLHKWLGGAYRLPVEEEPDFAAGGERLGPTPDDQADGQN